MVYLLSMKYDELYNYLLKIHSIAKIGLTYSKDAYALENYNEINSITKEMLENLQNVKIERNNYFVQDYYPTPNVSTRTFIFNDKGEILLVRESDTNTYSVPGGWCDLYDSPVEAAKNEVSQEAGIEVDIVRLLGITERTPFKANRSIPEYMLVFLGKMKGPFHRHTHETNDVAFFSFDNLPTMSNKVTVHELRRFYYAYLKGETLID